MLQILKGLITPQKAETVIVIPSITGLYLPYTVHTMGGPPAYSPMTKEVLTLLGKRVRLGRLERRWTVAELATRVGVSPVRRRWQGFRLKTWDGPGCGSIAPSASGAPAQW